MSKPPHWHRQSQIGDAEIGRVLKAARCSLGLDQVGAGARCGFSAATVSRWEQGKRNWTVGDLARVSAALNVPSYLVGLADSKFRDYPVAQVTQRASMRDDERMRRRTFLTAGLTAFSAAAAGGVSADRSIEQSLFGSADAEPVSLTLLTRRVIAAEHALDSAQLAELDRRLPALLGVARATWDSLTGTSREHAASLFSRALSVASHQQIRCSREATASVAADRAARYAELAGDPVAATEAARLQAIVLRRTGSPIAEQVMVDAAERLRTETSLRKPNEAGTYTRILASAAYTAAGNDDRGTATELLAAAGETLDPHGDTPQLTQAGLDVFNLSCDRALGDYGAALHRAAAIDVEAIPDANERGRYWQDVGVAAFGRGRFDLAVEAVAELDQTTPQYLLHRPWARKLVEDLLHTRTGGNSPLLHRLGGQLGI
ncbi:helix-turn-helix domain-containing protein [Glycomyces arizonensis]|uniref:helix-turn-helix domain-containing protein n=1 Tax=Glycomyces arizonensis TaxID=256035 RepID=UPI00041CF8D6|nr:helix-turn-helix transcriptional regulator [Glycomyces arizonensis]